MRLNFALLGCSLAGAIAASSAAADWHSPYFYRETSGTWTNVTYDDGVCHYYYSHNAYNNQTNFNKYGDCSRVAIGPDGSPQPVYVAPAPYVTRVR
jgi:opacity protein-like surface antigen